MNDNDEVLILHTGVLDSDARRCCVVNLLASGGDRRCRDPERASTQLYRGINGMHSDNHRFSFFYIINIHKPFLSFV